VAVPVLHPAGLGEEVEAHPGNLNAGNGRFRGHTSPINWEKVKLTAV